MGNITATGGVNNTKQGFVYDTASRSLPGNVAPASSGYAGYNETTGSYGTGAFAITLTPLVKSSVYYVRAYSYNDVGYSYGDEKSFTTLSDAKLLGTRILDTNRAVVAADDTDQTTWDKANPFIYAVQIGQDASNTELVAYKLQWRVSGGSWSNLAETGAIKYTTATVLTNAATLTSGNAKCTAPGNMTWQDGEEIEDGISGISDLGNDCYSELQFACDGTDGSSNFVYEFQLYNTVTASAIEIETGAYAKLINGWVHTVNGVSVPSAVNGIAVPQTVNGV
jgi:hypothetical protein